MKGHLGKLEVDRFLGLEKATTDAGRGQYEGCIVYRVPLT